MLVKLPSATLPSLTVTFLPSMLDERGPVASGWVLLAGEEVLPSSLLATGGAFFFASPVPDLGWSLACLVTGGSLGWVICW